MRPKHLEYIIVQFVWGNPWKSAYFMETSVSLPRSVYALIYIEKLLVLQTSVHKIHYPVGEIKDFIALPQLLAATK